MSIRADTGNHLTTGILASAYDGFGVLAEDVPSTGTHGAGYAYDSLSLPTDNGKEIQGLITVDAAVTSGTGTLTSFTAYEDTGFDLVVTGDCVVEWTWSLYVDGVLDASGLAGTVNIGGTVVVPAQDTLTFTSYAPTIIASDDTIVVPSAATLLSAGYAPTVFVSLSLDIDPSTASLIIEGKVPTVSISTGTSTIVSPELAELIVTEFNPTLVISDVIALQPSFDALSITGYEPVVVATDGANITVFPATDDLTFAGLVPNLQLSDNQTASPGNASLILTEYAPTLIVSGDVVLVPETAEILFTGYETDVVSSAESTLSDLQAQLTAMDAKLDIIFVYAATNL